MIDKVHNSGASKTPILDLETPLVRRRRNLLRVAFLLGLVSLIVAVSSLSVSALVFSRTYAPVVRIADYLNSTLNRAFGMDSPESFVNMFALFGIWCLIWFLTITVHEFGHVLAGMIMGFRFQTVFLGFLSFTLVRRKPRLDVHNSVPTAGMAIMEIQPLPRLRRRLLFFIAGGPAANLICGALGVLLMWSGAPQHAGLLGKSNVIFVVASVFTGVVNLVPLHTRGLTTDGAKLWALLGSRGRTRRWLSILALRRQLNANIRPGDWNRHWADSAGSILDNTKESLAGNWLAYLRAKSRKEIPEAASYLERCLTLFSIADPRFQDTLCWAATVFTGRFRNDVRKALAWYKRIKKPERLPRLLQLSAKLAIASSHNKFEAAQKICQQALELIRRSPLLPQYEADAWLEWQQEIEERRDKYNCGLQISAQAQ